MYGVTGSVATIKLKEILDALQALANERDIVLNIRVVATKHALAFIPEDIVNGNTTIYTDDREWHDWKQVGDPVLHIELRKWADMFAICPLDANTLAKLANGLCDNLLTCVARAWDVRDNTLIVFPAMNSLMWTHPLTQEHLAVLNRLAYQVVEPITKKLACGDYGALPSPASVAEHILNYWKLLQITRRNV